MMNKVLLAFAMKEEMAPWRRNHRFRSVTNSPHPVSVTSVGSTEVYVALAGAGAPNAPQLDELAFAIEPTLAIVTGVAAGLKPEWRPGHILVAETVSGLDRKVEIAADPKLIHHAVNCGAAPAPVLLTLPRIVRTVEEKLGLGTRADAADMESLPLMKHWSARGIPSLALRVILTTKGRCEFPESWLNWPTTPACSPTSFAWQNRAASSWDFWRSFWIASSKTWNGWRGVRRSAFGVRGSGLGSSRLSLTSQGRSF